MPDLSDAVRQDIEVRLAAYLNGRMGYSVPTYVGSGGSAAIYKVETPMGTKAIKVYDPKFLVGPTAKAEERRLTLQRSLIGHECPTLVKVFEVVEAKGTAFIEMEFVPWPQLRSVLEHVPDGQISTLVQQLVDAIMFLEKLDVVHRDIKPENIHVTDDFSQLKLIDLGVARTLSLADEEGEEATDHGQRRPFISTAQYSSPEYLFRLDAPSPTLWKALNLYQVGAVLHDLIVKKPLFQEEVDVGNRWVVARAVLTKIPTFPDADPLRLAAQKALATRCLVKDMNSRLQIVDWSDFSFEAAIDPLSALASKLSKAKGSAGNQAAGAIETRLRFERDQFEKRFCDSIRTELIAACDKSVHFTMLPYRSAPVSGYTFKLEIGPETTVFSDVIFSWLGDLQNSSAKVLIRAVLKCNTAECPEPTEHEVAVATIDKAEGPVARDVANRVAEVLGYVLDTMNAVPDQSVLHGADVGTLALNKE